MWGSMDGPPREHFREAARDQWSNYIGYEAVEILNFETSKGVKQELQLRIMKP